MGHVSPETAHSASEHAVALGGLNGAVNFDTNGLPRGFFFLVMLPVAGLSFLGPAHACGTAAVSKYM